MPETSSVAQRVKSATIPPSLSTLTSIINAHVSRHPEFLNVSRYLAFEMMGVTSKGRYWGATRGPSCDETFPACVSDAPATPQRSQIASLANDMWLDLHHCWRSPAACVWAISAGCVDTLPGFVIQVGGLGARGGCRNSPGSAAACWLAWNFKCAFEDVA